MIEPIAQRIYDKAKQDIASVSKEELEILAELDRKQIQSQDVEPILHTFLANEGIPLVIKMLEANKLDLKMLLDLENKTLLLLAAKMGPSADAVTKYLLENINDFGDVDLLNIPDNKGRTVLHYLYLYGNTELITLAEALGAKTGILDKENKRPDQYLFEEIPEKISTIGKEVSMEFGRSLHAHANFLCDRAKATLGYISGDTFDTKELLQHPNDLKLLKDPHAWVVVNDPTNKGVHYRVRFLDMPEREALLQKYSYIQTSVTLADIISQRRIAAKKHFLAKKYGLTDISNLELERGLRKAVANKRLADVKLFLELGVNPNSASPKDGKTPLHYAVEKKLTACVTVLLAHNAGLHRDHAKKTPLDIARGMNAAPLIQLLEGHQKTFDSAAGEEKKAEPNIKPALPSVKLLVQQGVANQGIKQAQQDIVQKTLGLLDKLKTEFNGTDPSMDNFCTTFTIGIILTLAKGDKCYDSYYKKFSSSSSPQANKAFQITQEYLAENPALRELSNPIHSALATHLQTQLERGNYARLRREFAVPLPNTPQAEALSPSLRQA